MDKAKELAKIAEEIEECPLCRKWGKGKAVPGEGNPDAGIVFIGEAPGREEAETGRPFVGRSGRFLKEKIKDISLDEKDVFMTSPVKYLPHRGTPSKENIIHASGHLLKQISVIDPRIIVLLGSTACLALLEKNVEISKQHGAMIEKDGKTYLITFHPASAMRFPFAKEGFSDDFAKLKKMIGKRRKAV